MNIPILRLLLGVIFGLLMGFSFPEIVGLAAMHIATINNKYQVLLNGIAPVLLLAPAFFIYGWLIKIPLGKKLSAASIAAIFTSLIYVFYINIVAGADLSFHLRSYISMAFFFLPYANSSLRRLGSN